jgi:hypothetical protein
MFALEKQHEKNFELIILGAKPSKNQKKLLVEHSITYLSLHNNIAAYNAHRLARTHARGKFILYLHASDVPHPALLKELLDQAASPDVFPMAKTCTNPADSLPSSFCYKKGSHKVSLTESNDMTTLCSGNDVLFGKLYLVEKLAVTELYPVELEVWMPFLDFLHYARKSAKPTLTNDVLIKRGKISPAYHHAVTFAAGIKASLPALQQYLSVTLSECHPEAVLEQVLFFFVPAHLSYLLEKPLSVLCLSVIYSHVAFYLDHCRSLFPERIDELISRTFASLFYGRYMSSVRVQSVHAWFIQREGYKPPKFDS